ncbi:MAG: DUF1778 domain-containing protein [Acidobacteria bacterium]|nr:DUF1778 domain-containing protein [Acidobacteriota bacterium]
MSEDQVTFRLTGFITDETGVMDANGEPLHYGDAVEFIYLGGAVGHPNQQIAEATHKRVHRGRLVPSPLVEWGGGLHSPLKLCDNLTRIAGHDVAIKIILNEEETARLMADLDNPPGPNDELKQAARDYQENVPINFPAHTLPHPIPQLQDIAEAAGGKIEEVTLLPDGHGFAMMSMPLPADHWLTQPDEFNVPPMPIRMGTDHPDRERFAEALTGAGRYAVRCATMNGKEMDFDPDALIKNLVVGMLGYHTPDGLSRDEWADPTPTPPQAEPLSPSEALYGFVAWLTTCEKSIVMGAAYNCDSAIQVLTKFIDHNGLSRPRDGWEKYFSHPPDKD